jgi:uncharacterized DUF497 family protein
LRYNFEWDPGKARQNFQKHKVAFEKAAEVFLDPLAVSIFDEDHSIDEERWITMGRDKKKIRIISARKATRNETKQYKGETS